MSTGNANFLRAALGANWLLAPLIAVAPRPERAAHAGAVVGSAPQVKRLLVESGVRHVRGDATGALFLIRRDDKYGYMDARTERHQAAVLSGVSVQRGPGAGVAVRRKKADYAGRP